MKNPALKSATALALIVIGYFGGSYAWQEHYLVPQVRKVVADTMLDPGSVEFRNEHFYPEPNIICGEFNAKNRMGAYTGFSRFVASVHKRYAIEGEQLAHWASDDALAAEIARVNAMLQEKTKRLAERQSQKSILEAAHPMNADALLLPALTDEQAFKLVDTAQFKKLWADVCVAQ